MIDESMPKVAKPAGETTVFLDGETSRKLGHVAKANNRSKAGQVRHWVAEAYEALEGGLPDEKEKGEIDRVINLGTQQTDGKEVIDMKLAFKEQGQGMVEYALILVLVAVVVIAAVTIMGPLVGNVFSTINDSL